MSMLTRRKRLLGGEYNIQIIEIKDHVSKKSDEGLLIKFKIQGELSIYTTRISNKAIALSDKLADVLCGSEKQISYEEAIGKICKFEVKINGDFINLIDVEKVDSAEYDKEISKNEDIITDDSGIDISDTENVYEHQDEDDIFEGFEFHNFDDEEFPGFDDEDPICFDDDEDLV